MVNVDKAVIARFKAEGDKYEILVDCEASLQFRQGKNVGMEDVLASEKIFTDAKRGIVASEHRMMAIFGTEDHEEIAKIILKKGEIQITAEHKGKETEEKKKQILAYIQRNGVDPKTHMPHPPQRIALAFEEAKVHIDDRKEVLEQVNDIIKKLQPILPIKFERKQIAIRIPGQYAAKTYGTVKGMSVIIKEEWLDDGSWKGIVEIPAGMQNDLFDKLNSMTHGSIESETVKIERI
ncbi:MAG: ribosome assembly factor SBDS [Candidatus Woesearchaeota archaeon]|jgi:ribosome maturation protein SDO1